MFDFLPTVGNCCFCFNLKIGSILIALCGLMSLGSLATIAIKPICGEETGLIPDIIKYYSYLSLGVNGLLMLTSLIFLIAACVEKFSISATLFIFCILLFLIVNLINLVVVLVAIITNSGCRQLLPWHALVFGIPLWFYFMIVVRSYKDEMV